MPLATQYLITLIVFLFYFLSSPKTQIICPLWWSTSRSQSDIVQLQDLRLVRLFSMVHVAKDYFRIQCGAFGASPSESRLYPFDIQNFRNGAASGLGAHKVGAHMPPREILDPPPAIDQDRIKPKWTLVELVDNV